MNDPFVIYAVLCLAAFAAGAVNSVAGGGTLLTFPALQQVFARRGLEAAGVLANGTSTFALMPGSIASAFAYRNELKQCRKLVLTLLAPSIIGGTLGSLLVTAFPPKVFDALIPWLILTAALLFVLQGPIKRWTGGGNYESPSTRRTMAVIVGQFLIAVYGGYFGAGIGILMLAVLPFMGTRTIHETNAAKTALAAVINGVTIIVFIIQGVIDWPYAIAMAIAAIGGGYAGGRIARRLPAYVVRLVVTVIGFSLAAYYLWKQFLASS